MNTFVLLMKLTDEGARAIYDAPARIDAGIKSFEAMGGKITGFWILTGEYRYLAVGEVPSAEVLMKFSAAIESQGKVRTMAIPAFTKEEFARFLGHPVAAAVAV